MSITSANFSASRCRSGLLRPAILKLGTWYAVVLEFSLGVLIWVKEFRYTLLALGVLFHLSLEYSINVPLFQWDVLSAYVLFIDAWPICSEPGVGYAAGCGRVRLRSPRDIF